MKSRILLPTLVLLSMILAACDPADLSKQNAHIAHPLTAETQVAVAVFDGPNMNDFDLGRLKRLAAESVRRNAGTVEVIVRTTSSEEEAAKAFGAQVVTALKREGVGAVTTNILVSESGDGSATVRVPVWTAVVPDCGTFKRGLNPDYDNAPHSNWGCSIQRNVGLMVKNPADLIRAREASGRDANRASDVLGKYGRGEATGSQAESKTLGSPSDVGASSGGK